MLPRTCLLAFVATATLSAQAPPTDAPAAAQRPWTFLIYAAIDNDAEADGNFFAFFDGVRAASADDSGLKILLFADRSVRYSDNATSLGENFTDARLYRVRSGSCERLAGGAEFPEITLTSEFEADSADPINLRKFLAFGKAHSPARHYALMLYGHADGRAMCPDEESKTEMGFAQLTEVVPKELSVDLMALELCNMGGIEIAYQWRPDNGGFSTRHLVAIPNAGPPLDWDRVFARLRTGSTQPGLDPARLTPAAFGELIVEEGAAGRRAEAERRPDAAAHLGFEAVACYDLDQAAAVKRAVDALAVALAQEDTRAICIELRGPGPEGFTLNYARDRLRRAPFVDLFDFASRLASSARLDEKARETAGTVATAVDSFVRASYGGASLPRFAPGRCGVYITFPEGESIVMLGRSRWDECRWYTPLPVPGVYGSLAWCRDGAKAGDGIVQNWFELLDCWFDRGNAGGGSNSYSH